MTYPGHVENATVVLDAPVTLPEGTKVEVAVHREAASAPDVKPSWLIAVELGASIPLEEWEKLPKDASKNLDHYLYGSTKIDQ